MSGASELAYNHIPMRNFIKDAFLDWMLGEIEGWLGYTISASPLPEIMRSTHAGAISPLGGKWNFWHNPIDPPSQFTILHELMHVVLHIEGWPMWATHRSIGTNNLLDELWSRVINFPQHVIINDRMHILKSISQDEQKPAMDNNVDSVKNQEQNPPFLQQEITVEVKIHAIASAELMLSPPDLLPDRIDRNVLQKDYPQCWILADSICRDVEMHRPLDRQSGAALLYKILEMLSLPKENLRPLPSGTRYYPQFFDHMLVKIGQILDDRHTVSDRL